MIKGRLVFGTLCGVLSGGLVHTAEGGAITFGAAATITATTDVSNAGSAKYAYCWSLGNRMLLHAAEPTRRQLAFWNGVCVPLSRLVDPLIGRRLGRSVLVVGRR